MSIGHEGAWGDRSPFTRLVLTGVGVAPAPARAAFAEMLTHPREAGRGGWPGGEDGFEPWLGPIRDAA